MRSFAVAMVGSLAFTFGCSSGSSSDEGAGGTGGSAGSATGGSAGMATGGSAGMSGSPGTGGMAGQGATGGAGGSAGTGGGAAGSAGAAGMAGAGGQGGRGPGPIGDSSLILCEGTGATTVSGRLREHEFTAAECGGTLPGDLHRGMLVKTKHCGASDWLVVDPRGGQTPGVQFDADDEVCADAEMAVAFVDVGGTLLSHCQNTSTAAGDGPGVTTYSFTGADCSGGTAVPTGWLGGIAQRKSCAADDWDARMSPDVAYNVRGMVACDRRNVGVVYADPMNNPYRGARVCTKAGMITAAGTLAVQFEAGDCGGELPTAEDYGVQRFVFAAGLDTDYVVRDAVEPGGPGFELTTTAAMGAYTVSALYIRP